MSRLHLFVLLWVGLSLAGRGDSSETVRKTYLIVDTSGSVLSWRPWGVGWQPLRKGMRLPESTLIQVGRGSSFSFELDSQAGFRGLRADSARIKINRPMILRLEGNVLRRVELSSYFIEKFPDITQTKDRKPASLLGNPLSEAWKRFAAFLPRDNRLRTLLGISIPTPEDQNDAEVAVRSRKIRMFTPADGAVGIAEQLPFETNVTWEKIPDSDALYEVTVWKANETKGPPLAVTHEDYYALKFSQPGSYFIQISAADGRWQSNVHRLEVTTSEAELKAETASSQSASSPLTLSLPPGDFTLVTIQVPVLFTFRWERPKSDFPVREYELVVADRFGKEMYRKKTVQEEGSLPIPDRGDYQWYVEAISAPTPDAPTADTPLLRRRSEVRLFHVEILGDLAHDAHGNRLDPFAALFQGSSKGVFYVEGGI